MLELAPELEAALTAGQTLIVPTAQRAAALRLGFAQRQLAQGRRAFRTPDVHSFGGWLRAQPTRGALRRLNASEEWLLWRAAVGEAAQRHSVPVSGALVDGLRRSVALLYEWRIPLSALDHSPTAEAALLSASLAAMHTRLADLQALAPWRALEDLAQDPPRRVPGFAGFDETTPARRTLLAAWADRGTPAREHAGHSIGAVHYRAYPADASEEFEMMAQWCRERLLRDPDARLRVIVPDLAERATELRRVFDGALDPAYLQRAASESPAPLYALEGGQSLLSFPQSEEWLRTLRVLTAELEFAEVSQWLRGPLWSAPTAAQRAALDVWLRGTAPARLDVGQLLEVLRAAPGSLLAAADAISTTLNAALTALEGTHQDSLGAWSQRFMRVLEVFALHPGASRQRTSHTQQVWLRVFELLQECATVPGACGAFSAVAAVATFAQLASRTRFEPATWDVAVTVSASLADPILRYDGIWAGGLHSAAIPQAARFDPFIPAALQREVGVSAADAAALVGQAQRALSTLWSSSAEFIVSAAAHADNAELAPSALLAPYGTNRYEVAQPLAPLSWGVRESRQIEHFMDDPGAHWPEAVALPAGTRAIELQSRCPFRAYAELRLGAAPVEEPVPGITALERGSMLHRALHLLWLRLGGSVGLGAAHHTGALADLTAQCVTQAATEVLESAPASDASTVLSLRRAAVARERERAQRLIGALCELEMRRAPFLIRELEHDHRLKVGEALLNLRIDRMDELGDGSYAILDYKSGRAVTPDWQEERTTHPQLLVYLMAAASAVSTLAVAHLHPKEVLFKGIADRAERLPGLKGLQSSPLNANDDAQRWPRQLEIWRAQVTRLAQDFIDGIAAVDPAQGACDYCHLQSFCRVAQSAAVPEESDPDLAVSAP